MPTAPVVVDNKPAPGQTGPKGMAPRTTYSRVNTGPPPSTQVGLDAKAAPPRGLEFLPQKVAAEDDSMTTTITPRPISLQDLVKSAAAGTLANLDLHAAAARVLGHDLPSEEPVKVAAEVGRSEPDSYDTDTINKFAAALEQVADALSSSGVGPGQGGGVVPVLESIGGQNEVLPGHTGEARKQPPVSALSSGGVQSGDPGNAMATNDGVMPPKTSAEQLSGLDHPDVVSAMKEYNRANRPVHVGAATGGVLGAIGGGVGGARLLRHAMPPAASALVGGVLGAAAGSGIGHLVKNRARERAADEAVVRAIHQYAPDELAPREYEKYKLAASNLSVLGLGKEANVLRTAGRAASRGGELLTGSLRSAGRAASRGGELLTGSKARALTNEAVERGVKARKIQNPAMRSFQDGIANEVGQMARKERKNVSTARLAGGAAGLAGLGALGAAASGKKKEAARLPKADTATLTPEERGRLITNTVISPTGLSVVNEAAQAPKGHKTRAALRQAGHIVRGGLAGGVAAGTGGALVGTALEAASRRARPGALSTAGGAIGALGGAYVGQALGARNATLKSIQNERNLKKSASLLLRNLSSLGLGKQAEDALNPAQVSGAQTSSDPMHGAPPTGVPAQPSDVTAQSRLIASNEAAINFTKGDAKAAPKKDMNQLLDEPAQSAATDKVLAQAFSHTSQAGPKIASRLVKTAASHALLLKLAEEAKIKKDEDARAKKEKQSMMGGGGLSTPAGQSGFNAATMGG